MSICPAEISFIISAPFLTHSSATLDLNVSIEIIRLELCSFTSFIAGINLSNSIFSETGLEPGLEEDAPISIIFAPSFSIFLIWEIIFSLVKYLPPS